MPPDEEIKESEQAEGTSDEDEVLSEDRDAAVEQLPPPAQEPISPAKEHNWAMLAHLSILLNLFTGFLGPVVALII